MNSKRYDKVVRATLRMPPELNQRAKEIVRQLHDTNQLVTVPGIEKPVKASIAVLALRGLDDELNYWQQVIDGEIDPNEREGVAS